MSLKTVTATLDNKLRTLRDSNIDEDMVNGAINNENLNPSGSKRLVVGFNRYRVSHMKTEYGS